MPTKSLSLEEIAQEDDQTRLLTELQTSRTGLTKDEVTRRQAQDGPNVLKQIKGASWLTKFTQNFTSMMAILLWVAGAIAFVAQLEELGIAIWLVNIINGLFSFWQEYQAGVLAIEQDAYGALVAVFHLQYHLAAGSRRQREERAEDRKPILHHQGL